MAGITRKIVVTMKDNGEIDATCRNGSISGSVAVSSQGDWVWNVWEGDRQRSTAYGSESSQWLAYGALLSKLFELTT